MHQKHTLYVACIALAIELCGTRAEFFTSISELESLLETHKRTIDDLQDYIQKEEKRLDFLKKQVSVYRREHDMAMADVPNYLGNPINAYTLIKRLTTDLDFIKRRIKHSTEFVRNVTSNNTDVKYPTPEDLTGAAQALTRLQNTYKLDIAELAEGKLNGVIYGGSRHTVVSTPLSASDCYELGRVLYNVDDYQNSLRWMEEALRKYKTENEVYSFTEVDILDFISYLYYLLDDGQTALTWANNILSLDPHHQRTQSLIPYYLKNVAEKKERLAKYKAEVFDEEEEFDFVEEDKKNYLALCRGEMDVPSQISRKLKCSYLTKNHPFLKIAPIKTEQMYIDPDVFVYHQVLSDAEIEHIKTLVKHRLRRATIIDILGEVTAECRISKLAWLHDEESSLMARVSRRVADFTGLSVDSAEPLQVVNYGIGGHYEAHYDCSLKNSLPIPFGDRTATVLFYMSEVAQGGATVFNELGLSVFPVKSSALVWRNLHPSGEGDITMRHAACPVLQGSKWVSNKWLHQRGQELLAPCNLEYQREDDIRKIIKATPRAKV